MFVDFFQSKYIQIFICAVFLLRNIFGYSFVQHLWKRIYLNFYCFPENVKKWLFLVQNNTKYENGKHSPKRFWENYLIFKCIRIFWTNLLICQHIRWFFLGWIYLDIHSWSFYHAEYIRIFNRPISIVTNIFRYSFVQKKDIRPTPSHTDHRSVSYVNFHNTTKGTSVSDLDYCLQRFYLQTLRNLCPYMPACHDNIPIGQGIISTNRGGRGGAEPRSPPTW